MSDTGGANASLERKLATILSADVAGYSRLMAEDEEATLRTFRGHKEVFESLAALHRGRIFNTAGDAILAEFGSAVEAVRCATEIQAALQTRNEQLPPERRVCFRIGVNLGDVMVQEGDLLGDGVNLAARLQTAAEPGGICVAGSVYDQIRNKLTLSFKPLGEMNYKNIPLPVRTFAIAGVDGIGPLPAPAPRRRRGLHGANRLWAIAAAALLLAIGAAVWGVADYRQRVQQAAQLAAQQAAELSRRQAETAKAAELARRQAETAKAAERAPAKQAANEARQQADAERRAAEAARQQANAAQDRIQPAAPGLAEARQSGAAHHRPPEQLATVETVPARDPPPAAIAVPRGRPGEDRDGIYGGQVCLGPIAAEPARCYRAQAVVTRNRITGEWPAREHGAMMHLAGAITGSGAVAIHMHGQRADGSRFGVGDLVGSLHDGKLEASGNFLNGRSINLTWRKN